MPDAQTRYDNLRREARTGKSNKQTKQEKLDAIASRRGDWRNGDEAKSHLFHVATFLMERNMNRRLGFNAFQVALDAEILMSIGKRLASYSVASCNVGLNDRQEASRDKVADKAREVAGWYDLKAQCHGDPRGYVLRLTGDDVKQNGFGDGFGVA